MRNRPARGRRRAERVAELAGAALRVVGLAAPGTLGAGLICAGLWLAWPPLAFLVGGAFLLLLDRRMP